MKNTKIGDIFSVNLNESEKRFFQYIVSDLTQLNSDVIRVFTKVYLLSETPTLLEIINDEISFYAHCVTAAGIKMGVWQKIGNTVAIGDYTHVVFRGTSDYGKGIKVSQNWYIWKINDREFQKVGELVGANQKAEIGVVFPPHIIVYRIKNGYYDFVYPDYK